MGRKRSHIAPGAIVFLSFIGLIIVGALALMHPACRTQAISFIDILFTATSATCITGLFTISLDQFTTMGHAVILALIQIGGLGLITLSVFMISLFGNLGLTTKLVAGELLDLDESRNLRSIISFVVRVTLCVELIGAALAFFVFRENFSDTYAFFLSLFHSISSFCNAGVTLFDTNLLMYGKSVLLMVITMVLMLFGGFGFVTWQEIVQYCRSLSKRKRYAFSLHSRIILYGSAILILFTTFIILSLEYKGALAPFNMPFRMFNALFQAISFRSAGFLTLPLAALHPATLLVALGIAFIGASPLSTGSGIKITTFAVMLATVKAALAGRMTVRIGNRQIAFTQVYKALAIAIISVFWILFTIFCLMITEQQATFYQIFVESISAFANLGISTGYTPHLSSTGKLFIMASMLVGRVGSVTLILALRKLALGNEQNGTEYTYPEERVMLS